MLLDVADAGGVELWDGRGDPVRIAAVRRQWNGLATTT